MKAYPLWTALFINREHGLLLGCYNVQIGHSQGPLIKYETAYRLARNYKRRNRTKLKKHKLYAVKPNGRQYNGW